MPLTSCWIEPVKSSLKMTVQSKSPSSNFHVPISQDKSVGLSIISRVTEAVILGFSTLVKTIVAVPFDFALTVMVDKSSEVV